MKQYLIATTATLAAVVLAACGNADHDANHSDMDHAHSGDITVSDASARLPLPGQTTGAAYMSVKNMGKAADRIIGASSPVSDQIELHTHLNEDGVMKMRRVQAIELTPGETVKLEPGSFHIMIFDMAIPEGTEAFELTLDFENAEDLTVSVPAGAIKSGGMDHSGH